jgi:periplasmic protein TonB
VASALKKARPTAPVEETPVLSADSIEQADIGFPGDVSEGTTSGLGVPPPPSSSEVRLRIGGSVKAPRLVYGLPPEYPRSAREAQVQGDVQIDTVVDKDGNVVEMKVLNGPPMLTAAALKAISQWKYEPTCVNGTPYPLEMVVGVSFRLFDSADEAWGYVIA